MWLAPSVYSQCPNSITIKQKASYVYNSKIIIILFVCKTKSFLVPYRFWFHDTMRYWDTPTKHAITWLQADLYVPGNLLLHYGHAIYSYDIRRNLTQLVAGREKSGLVSFGLLELVHRLTTYR